MATKIVLMGLAGSDIDCPKPDLYKKAVISAQKEYIALLALSVANGTRFGGLKDKLENKSLLGTTTTRRIRQSFSI